MIKKIIILLIIFLNIQIVFVSAKELDSDRDGVPDKDEIEVYYTDPYDRDTDGDGYSDWVELNHGYSPHNIQKLKLEESDTDGDGLSDRMELRFHTNLMKADTDGDGYSDYKEINNGFNPRSTSTEKLDRRIEINLEKQELNYFIDNVHFYSTQVSTGRPDMPTPIGEYKIRYKHPKAWSRSYGLWMPYWMEFEPKYGIHELPVWPSGYREGEEHLGQKVSHGCVRLGIGAAKKIYDWVDIGTRVKIH